MIAGVWSERLNHVVASTGPDGRFVFEGTKDAEKLRYALAYKAGLAPASKFLPILDIGSCAPD